MKYRVIDNKILVDATTRFKGFTAYDTWEEAHKYLLDKAHERIKDAEDAFKKACKDRELIENMKP